MTSHSVKTAETNGRRKTASLPARTQPMKSHRLFVYYSPPSFLFISTEAFSFGGLAYGLALAAVPELQFSADSNSSLLEKYLAVYLF